MKILITGICGFAGSTLARSFIDAGCGHELYGIDNLMRPGSELNRQVLKKLGVSLLHADIRVQSDFENFPKVDWVIDAAASPSVLAGVDKKITSRQLLEHNLSGTVNMLEFCKKYKAGFILLSTSRVYSIAALAGIPVDVVNNAFRPVNPDKWPAGFSAEGVDEAFSTFPPVSLYGSTKVCSEILALEYGQTFEFPVWINRCGVLAGSWQFGHAEQGIFSYWIHAWLRKDPLKYIGFGGGGHQVRDCLHPRDLQSVLIRQMNFTENPEYRIFNLAGGTGNSMSLAQLSSWCNDHFGPHTVVPDPEARRFDVPWLVLNSERARKFWKWQPETSMELILEEIAAFARHHSNWLDISAP